MNPDDGYEPGSYKSESYQIEDRADDMRKTSKEEGVG